MTESFYYESAAFIAASIASGVSIQTPHPAKAVLVDYVTPLEMETTTEMALACAGMTRREANRVVNALLPRYEKDLATADFNLLEERSENYRKLKALLNDSVAIVGEAYLEKIKRYSEALIKDAKTIKNEAREELILD